MSNFGCCGIDCDVCEARRATARCDNAVLAKIAAAQEIGDRGTRFLHSSIAPALYRLARARRKERQLRRMRHTRLRA